MANPIWAYGITTVQERRNTTLPRTVMSLKAGGFDDPRLFIDNDDDVHSWKKQYGRQCSIRYPIIKAWGNWILSLYELYIRYPAAGRYALFQDDIVVVKNLRQYLETCPFKPKQYWNLITYPVNQALAPADTQGWFQANQMGKGAQALVFDRMGVLTLLTSALVVERPQHIDEQGGGRGTKLIDGGVVDAMKAAKITEMCHNPSLVFHIGEKSTAAVGHGRQPDAPSFPGENFDAMQLKTTAAVTTPSKNWMLGDHVAKALSMVGITSERVEKWIGGECGCKERREKLNAIGEWAKKVLGGGTENAKDALESMVGK